MTRGLSSPALTGGAPLTFRATPTPPSGSHPSGENMYELNPADWGPGRHNPLSPHSHHAVQQALDLRDTTDQRPDDN